MLPKLQSLPQNINSKIYFQGLKDKQEISLDSTATTSSQTKQQSKLGKFMETKLVA